MSPLARDTNRVKEDRKRKGYVQNELQKIVKRDIEQINREVTSNRTKTNTFVMCFYKRFNWLMIAESNAKCNKCPFVNTSNTVTINNDVFCLEIHT